MKIDFANLKLAYQEHKEQIDKSISDVINTSSFIMGEDVRVLETLTEDKEKEAIDF